MCIRSVNPIKTFTAVILAALALAATLAASASGFAIGDNHWCRHGDPPMLASPRTSCAFAGKAYSKWVQAGTPRYLRARVYSPTTHHTYRVTFRGNPRYVTGTGANGIWFWVGR
jgi:hypothetical protein